MEHHKVRHPRCDHKLTRVERMYLSNTTLFIVEVHIVSLHNVQLHVSALTYHSTTHII
jgi:hypothetical protein